MFGRYTAILSEHQHLGQALRELDEMCVMLDAHDRGPPLEQEPVRLMAAFLEELSQHFAAEEADDYFGTMAREQPNLASAIAHLEAEHRAMLETLHGLVKAVADERNWPAVARAVRRVMVQLRAHEHRETQVMQGFMLRDEGTGAD